MSIPINSWLATSAASTPTLPSTQSRISPSIPSYYQPFQNSQVAAIIPTSMSTSTAPSWSQCQIRSKSPYQGLSRCSVMTDNIIARAMERSKSRLGHRHCTSKNKNGVGSGGPNKKKKQSGFKIPRKNKQPFFSASDSSSSSGEEDNDDGWDDVVIIEDLRKNVNVAKTIPKANKTNLGVDVAHGKLPGGDGIDQGVQAQHCTGCSKLESTVEKLQGQFSKMETITSQLVESLNCLKIGIAAIPVVVPPTPTHDIDFVNETLDEDGMDFENSSQNQYFTENNWNDGSATPRISGMVKIGRVLPSVSDLIRNQLRDASPQKETPNVVEAEPNSLIPASQPLESVASSQSQQLSIAPRFVFSDNVVFTGSSSQQNNNDCVMEPTIVFEENNNSSSVPAPAPKKSHKKKVCQPKPAGEGIAFPKKSHKKKVFQPKPAGEGIAFPKKSHKKKIPEQPPTTSVIAVAKTSRRNQALPLPEEDIIDIFGSSDDEVGPVSPQWHGARSYLLQGIGTTTRRSTRIAAKRSETEH